jgi:hypothetical protein
MNCQMREEGYGNFRAQERMTTEEPEPLGDEFL